MSKGDRGDKGPSTTWFAFITVAYLLAVMLGAWCLGYFDPAGTPIAPNEWGDVLAGVFSPLAFLWLLYASLSQRAELELQREELKQNNFTQDAQREEMQRQVEAMTAQAKLLEAQAAATFDPVFIVRQIAYAYDRYTTVIENRGSAVMNIYFQGDFKISYYNGGSTGFDSSADELYFWESGSSVSLLWGDIDVSSLHQVSVQYTRKDGAAKRNVYLLSIGKGSLRLIQSDQVMPSIGNQ
jgi:hypothetical protein